MSRIRRAEAEQWQERRATSPGPSPRVWKNRKESKLPHCENCGRETEYLFAGVKAPPPPPDPSTLRRFKGDMRLALALSAPFMAEAAEVCFQCRPPSNLEIKELVHEASRNARRKQDVGPLQQNR